MKKLLLFIIILNASASSGADLVIPATFVSHTPATAHAVNLNFSAVKSYVDAHDTRLADLEAAIALLQTSLSTANTTISDLQTDLTALTTNVDAIDTRLTTIEGNTVLELDGLLLYSEFNGYATAEFSAVNVQVNNGSGSTAGLATNGLGNIIIGYNEVETGAQSFCLDPSATSEIACLNLGEVWDNNVHTGSHNLVLGRGNSYAQAASIASGREVISNADYSFVTGKDNYVNGLYSTISGGFFNTASGAYTSISGGRFNLASGDYSSISGGTDGDASGATSSILGGFNNLASGSYSIVSGGRDNDAANSYSSISGGRDNLASGSYSAVTGGKDNIASGVNSSVTGGDSNESGGPSSSVSGGNHRVTSGSFDWKAGSLFENF